MASDEVAVPGRLEISRQLKRISDSDIFRNATSQLKLLQVIVVSFLDNTDISSSDLTAALFPKGHVDPQTAVGRVTVGNLRGTLNAYYRTEGNDDPVIIKLPRGKAYKPKIHYNPRSKACIAFLRGMAHLNACFSDNDVRLALTYLAEAIHLDPNFSAAYAAKAQTEFALAIYAHDVAAATWIERSELSAREAVRCNPASWLAYTISGMVHTSRFKWDAASEAFDNAFKIDGSETGRHSLYIAYLMALGRVEEAERAARAKMLDSPSDPFARLIVACILYVSRGNSFISAFDVLFEITREYRTFAFADVLKAYVAIGLGKETGGLMVTTAKGMVESFHRLLGIEAFPGLLILAMNAQMMVVSDHRRLRNEKAEIHDKMARLEIQAREGYVPHFQLALGYMGVEEWDDALQHLAFAMEENDPKMLWLHLWPMFDPIRTREEFKRLVHKMNLPGQ